MALINRDLPAPRAWPPPNSSDDVRSLHAYCRARDPVGHNVHIALAMLHLFSLPVSTAFKDITFTLVVGYALLRLPNTWRCYTPLLRNPLLWVLLAWTLFSGLSVLWTVDTTEGLTELKAFRVILLPWALWPVLDRTPWLIAAFLFGVFWLNLIQLAQRIGVFGLTLEGDNRARGGLHPIQTGAMCLAAITWYLPALGRCRAAALRHGQLLLTLALFGGFSAAMFGLIFSGSRGSWLAAAIILPLCWIVLFIRFADDRRMYLAWLVATLLVGLVLWFAGGDQYVRDRIELAQTEYREAIEQRDYTTSVGNRVVISIWAWRFFSQDPIIGQGLGSFRNLSMKTPELAQLAEDAPQRAAAGKFTPSHPHSLYLHVLVSTGLIGGFLAACAMALTLWYAAREPINHRFAGATIFVMLGWMIGTNFDSYHLNGHLFGLFAMIAALALPHRPESGSGLFVAHDDTDRPITKNEGSTESNTAT